MKIENVEDLIEVLAGLHDTPVVEIEDVDKTIVYSIARQTFRKKALTDRQLAVMLQKLEYYKDKFTFVTAKDWANAINSLRMPLREIDRTKSVTIVTDRKELPADIMGDYDYIKIRFPFSKKIIMDVQDKLAFKFRKEHFHEKGSHAWYFKVTENTIHDIVDLFKNKEFDIDQELLDSYEKIKDILDTPYEHLPGIYNNELKNLPQAAVNYLYADVGPVTEDNLVLYKDRSLMFGLCHFGKALEQSLQTVSNLAGRIATRNSPSVFINSTKWNTNELVHALYELKRFPVAVVVPEKNALDLVSQFYNATRNLVPAEQQTVLFRLDNANNSEFNQYVKEHNLNNSLANDIKIVYINENKKIPKPLLESDIVIKTSLYFSSYMFSKQHVEVDLAIQYDSVASPHARYGLDRYRKITEEI